MQGRAIPDAGKSHHSETDFLSALTLLRNDPNLLTRALPQARAGNVHAQYAVGLIYAEGRGVAADPVAAYIWLSRAMAQGDSDARDLRSMLMLAMADDDIVRAEQVLKEEAGI
ncbi:MAG: SEL1-like repeat protein [Gammaproteobacteria bacterium]|jgi:uncharacterized protein